MTAGLAKYFSWARAVLVNADGGALDGTPDVVANASVDLGALLVPAQSSPLRKIVEKGVRTLSVM